VQLLHYSTAERHRGWAPAFLRPTLPTTLDSQPRDALDLLDETLATRPLSTLQRIADQPRLITASSRCIGLVILLAL
jgi:hypothetical protein